MTALKTTKPVAPEPGLRRAERPVAQLVTRLGGAPAIAAGLGLPAGEEGHRVVRAWVFRDSIPSEWFTALARFATDAGHPEVTVSTLAAMAQARRLSRPGAKLRVVG